MTTERKNSKHYLKSLKTHYLVDKMIRSVDGAVIRDDPNELYSLCDQILEPGFHKFSVNRNELNCKNCLKKLD
jgi:hypothetical protein